MVKGELTTSARSRYDIDALERATAPTCELGAHDEERRMPREPVKPEKVNPESSPNLANRSVNSSRRSGQDETGTGNPAHDANERESAESAKVPDQQIPNR